MRCVGPNDEERKSLKLPRGVCFPGDASSIQLETNNRLLTTGNMEAQNGVGVGGRYRCVQVFSVVTADLII